MRDNDFLFKQNGDKPILKQPEKCDTTCIHFHTCRFPKNCPVLVRERMRSKQYKGL